MSYFNFLSQVSIYFSRGYSTQVPTARVHVMTSYLLATVVNN